MSRCRGVAVPSEPSLWSASCALSGVGGTNKIEQPRKSQTYFSTPFAVLSRAKSLDRVLIVADVNGWQQIAGRW